MGVQVELPTLRKKKLVVRVMEATPRKGSKPEMDHESWQWGAYEDPSTDKNIYNLTESHPTTRLSTNFGGATDASTLADSPDGSLKHLISPSTTCSSPGSPSSPLDTISPSFKGGMCVDPFGSSNIASHRRLRKEKSGDSSKDSGSMSSAASAHGESRPSRWDSGRWTSPANSNWTFEDANRNSGIRAPRGNQVCKCAAGITADVAVVCCCPLSVLHLLAIAFIKFPAAVMTKTATRIKRKIDEKRQRPPEFEVDVTMTTPATSFPPSRCNSYEGREAAPFAIGDQKEWSQTWAAAPVVFGDHKQWREYFDSPDATGAWSTGDPLRAKS